MTDPFFLPSLSIFLFLTFFPPFLSSSCFTFFLSSSFFPFFLSFPSLFSLLSSSNPSFFLLFIFPFHHLPFSLVFPLPPFVSPLSHFSLSSFFFLCLPFSSSLFPSLSFPFHYPFLFFLLPPFLFFISRLSFLIFCRLIIFFLFFPCSFLFPFFYPLSLHCLSFLLFFLPSSPLIIFLVLTLFLCEYHFCYIYQNSFNCKYFIIKILKCNFQMIQSKMKSKILRHIENHVLGQTLNCI